MCLSQKPSQQNFCCEVLIINLWFSAEHLYCFWLIFWSDLRQIYVRRYFWRLLNLENPWNTGLFGVLGLFPFYFKTRSLNSRRLFFIWITSVILHILRVFCYMKNCCVLFMYFKIRCLTDLNLMMTPKKTHKLVLEIVS